MEDKITMLKKQLNDLIDRLTKEENEYQKMVKEYARINSEAMSAFRRFEKVAIAQMTIGNTDASWQNMVAAGATARPDLRDDWMITDSTRREHEMRVEAQKQRVISLRLLIEVNMSILEMETK
jgi:sugar-specific transcriptional regulator TrmB